MKKASVLFLAAILVGLMVGCSSEKPVAEAPESKAQANEAAAGWSPEAKAAFEQANKRARTGADSGPAGAPATGK